MKDIQLSPHFKLSEFEKSSTARARGINNSLNPDIPQHAEIIANIKALCTEVLEPLRQHIGKPIFISSGYRCPKLNSHPEVRGATKSQHMKGEAADLRIPSLTEARKWMEWIANELAFDQLILEHCKNKDGSTSHWIHVSYRKDGNNRHQILRLTKK